MMFWESVFSNALGAFIGVIGGFFIAKWQMNKSQQLSNIPFYIHFNFATIYFNKFAEEAEEILELLEENRTQARIVLNKYHYIKLKNTMEKAIKAINPEISQIDYDNFLEELIDFSKYAPVAHYKDFNYIFLCMVVTYNILIEDSKYLVNDLPSKINIVHSYDFIPYPRFWLKQYKKKLQRIKKQLNI